MSLKVTFELSDRDLKSLRKEMRRVSAAAKNKSDADIIAAANDVLHNVPREQVPEFVAEWLDKVATLIAMLEDSTWQLQQREREKVRSALCYLSDPEDLIRDDIPGLGLLDDAIAVKLIVRDLRHEIDAYADFCHFCQTRQRPEQEIERRRSQLQQRMRRRRLQAKNAVRATFGFWG